MKQSEVNQNVKCAFDEMIDSDLLIPNPRNPNKHPENQIKLLAKIMNHQGWRSPIVVSTRSGFIIKGHGRLAAAKLNGWSQTPVDYQDYENEADEYADMVADNKIAELAESDMGMILTDMKDFPDMDTELLGVFDFTTDCLPEIENTSAELDLTSFDNFQHQCPKCNFEWNDNATSA